MSAKLSATLDASRSALRQPVVGGIVAAFLHYIAFWGSFLFGASLGMSDFDEGPTFTGFIGRLLFLVSYVLGIPLGSLLMHMLGPTAAAQQQHMLLALNSVLWGSVVALVLLWRTHRRQSAQPST